MGISFNPELSDVLTGGLSQGSISVSTIAVEAKVGVNRQEKRQALRIYNNSSTTIYWGNASVTHLNGEPIFKNQFINIPVGDQIGVYLITESGSASDVRIQEWF